MKEVLTKKIEELGKEAQELVRQREILFSNIQEIEVRLHQISGAISELDKLLNTEDKNNPGKDGRA